MGNNAAQFLSSFNRIEKWLKETLSNPTNMGFSEMTRRVAHKEKKYFSKYEDDLLQMAQLRNAIVHERIASDFVIAEPNEWAVNRIQTIEQALLKPELVLPRFRKNVTRFDVDMQLIELLNIVAKEKYSQFPMYKKGQFAGLITAGGLGIWFAVESTKGEIRLQGRKAAELLENNYKVLNYQFVHSQTRVDEVEAFFSANNLLETILITKNGQVNEPILGIIRPKDLYTSKEKE